MLIHIGFHKTGTSWLQQTLFATDPFVTPWRSREIAAQIILPNELSFDSAEALRALEDVAESGGGSTGRELLRVLSWERLSGSPHAGGFDAAQIAGRLHEMYPDARVLIGVREQRSMTLALYRQYVRDGGVATLRGYLFPRNPAEIPQFRFEHLEYHRLVERYMELFGRERVLVLPQEDLSADSVAFARKVCGFFGVDQAVADRIEHRTVYASLGDVATALKRHANKVLVRSSLSPGARYYVKNHEARFERLDRLIPAAASRPVEQRWKREVADAVGDRFGVSNARLSELIERDLSEFGYDVPD